MFGKWLICFHWIESLAYVMAATHGLDEQAEQIKESLDENVIDIVKFEFLFV